MEQGRPTIKQMEAWVREVVGRHGDDGDRFAFSGILEDRDRLRSELATARGALVESLEARRVAEAEGGPLNQANNEIDHLQARVAELRDALLESMGTEGGIPMTDRLADALEACGADLEGRREPAATQDDVVTVPVKELATLREIVRLLDEARQRYTRMPRAGAATSMGDEIDEPLNKLYEMGAHPADTRPKTPVPDVVTVPREEWEALNHLHETAEVFRVGPWPDGGMPMAIVRIANASVAITALRSGEAEYPDGYQRCSTCDHLNDCPEYLGKPIGSPCRSWTYSRSRDWRSEEAGKGGVT